MGRQPVAVEMVEGEAQELMGTKGKADVDILGALLPEKNAVYVDVEPLSFHAPTNIVLLTYVLLSFDSRVDICGFHTTQNRISGGFQALLPTLPR